MEELYFSNLTAQSNPAVSLIVLFAIDIDVGLWMFILDLLGGAVSHPTLIAHLDPCMFSISLSRKHYLAPCKELASCRSHISLVGLVNRVPPLPFWFYL